jgi:hypothetical protein
LAHPKSLTPTQLANTLQCCQKQNRLGFGQTPQHMRLDTCMMHRMQRPPSPNVTASTSQVELATSVRSCRRSAAAAAGRLPYGTLPLSLARRQAQHAAQQQQLGRGWLAQVRPTRTLPVRGERNARPHRAWSAPPPTTS